MKVALCLSLAVTLTSVAAVQSGAHAQRRSFPDAFGNPQSVIHGGFNGLQMSGMNLGYLASTGAFSGPLATGASAYGSNTPGLGGSGSEAGSTGEPNPMEPTAAGAGFYREQLPGGLSMKVPTEFSTPAQNGVMAKIMESHVTQQSQLLRAIHAAEQEAHAQAHAAAVAAMDAKAALWRLQQARRSAHYSRGILASLHRELAALDLSKERVVEQAHLNSLQNQLISSESLMPFSGANLATSPLQKALDRSKKTITSINEEIKSVLSPKDAPKALEKYQEAEKKEEAAHKELEAAAKLREESDALNTAYAPDLIAQARLKLASLVSGSGSGSAAAEGFRFAEVHDTAASGGKAVAGVHTADHAATHTKAGEGTKAAAAAHAAAAQKKLQAAAQAFRFRRDVDNAQADAGSAAHTGAAHTGGAAPDHHTQLEQGMREVYGPMSQAADDPSPARFKSGRSREAAEVFEGLRAARRPPPPADADAPNPHGAAGEIMAPVAPVATAP